jgi:hypothetical protein
MRKQTRAIKSSPQPARVLLSTLPVTYVQLSEPGPKGSHGGGKPPAAMGSHPDPSPSTTALSSRYRPTRAQESRFDLEALKAAG